MRIRPVTVYWVVDVDLDGAMEKEFGVPYSTVESEGLHLGGHVVVRAERLSSEDRTRGEVWRMGPGIKVSETVNQPGAGVALSMLAERGVIPLGDYIVAVDLQKALGIPEVTP